MKWAQTPDFPQTPPLKNRQPRPRRKQLQGMHPQQRIAAGVQRGGPDAQGELVGYHGDDAAAYAAFARQADAVGELSGGVVGAAGQHQGVEAAGLAFGDDGRALVVGAVGVVAVAAQVTGGAGHLLAAHADGALVEVQVQHGGHGVVELAEAFHEVGQRVVTKAGVGLGAGHFGVEVYRLVAQVLQHGQQ